MTPPASEAAERLIKKYPNRRLYDTATSTYITLAEIKDMILRHEPVRIVDAKSGEDLTRSVFLQILLEEEIAGTPIFTTEVLANIIRFYGHAAHSLMGQYLENSLRTFVELQKQMQERLKAMYGEQATLPPEMMAQFLALQPAAMQTLMQSYLEQSQHLWRNFQQQMERQALGWLEAFYPNLRQSPVGPAVKASKKVGPSGGADEGK